MELNAYDAIIRLQLRVDMNYWTIERSVDRGRIDQRLFRFPCRGGIIGLTASARDFRLLKRFSDRRSRLSVDPTKSGSESKRCRVPNYPTAENFARISNAMRSPERRTFLQTTRHHSPSKISSINRQINLFLSA